MKKNLRSQILLCVLAGGVLAANTALAKEYTETINGANDTSYSAIKEQSGNDYTYNFSDGDVLKLHNINEDIEAVNIRFNSADTLALKNGLDISITAENSSISVLKGLFIDAYNQSNKILDRSDGGDIEINVINNNKSIAVHAIQASGGTNGTNIIKAGNGNVNIYVENQGKVETYGILAESQGKVIYGNGDINVTAKNNGSGITRSYGIYQSEDGSTITKGNGNIEAIANGTGQTYAYGVRVFGEDVKLGEGDIIASATGTANSAQVQSYGIDVSANLEKGNGKITAIATGGKSTAAYGVLGGEGALVNFEIVDISAEAVYSGENNVRAIGVYTYNNNTINIDGGSISAKTNEIGQNAFSIYTYSGTTNINQTGGNDVVINGNVYDYGGVTNLNLDTSDSVLNGAAMTSGGKLTINLCNSATWNNGSGYSSVVSNLNMDNGIINQIANRNITINNYTGTGDIYFKAEDNAVDGVLDFTNTGDVTIQNARAGSVANLSVSNNTVNTLDVAKTEENLNAIANKIIYNADNSNLTGKVRLAEGLITPEASGDLLFDENNQGYVSNITGGDKVTTTMDAMKNIAATAIVAWRQEDSTLSQRLGELRESDGGQGVWVRMSRGEFEYDGEYKNQYNFFQLGYDWAAGNWHYGAAVSHNDGQTTYTNGDGENRSTSLSLYGTWLGDKGHYADIVLKQGRLSNDFDIYTEAGHTSGDYDAWGTSLSGEYGMKIDLNDGWFITPQAQLTIMRIGGEDYTTNNVIKVHQESLESAVGRIGFEVGKRISGSGSIYAKASLLHDFAGSADTYLSLNGLTNSYHQDIGDTWCEAGLGMNFKTSDNSYIYADIVKTFGGDVETPWQWNAGMRWTF